MKKNHFQYLFVGVALITFLVTSCKKDEISNNEIVNRQLYAEMKDLYLWYDKLPSINPLDYSNPDDMMNALRYKPLDRWSFVLPWDEYFQYFQEGKMIGHGFMISRDEDYNLRIGFIYPSTTAYSLGVRRGWIIKKVNGISANVNNIMGLLGESSTSITNTIDFINNNSIETILELRKEEININPELYSTIISSGDKKIGYIVFQDFIDAANSKLDSVFTVFKAENINYLIFDMRYNGGGSVDVAIHLSGWLTKSTHSALINIIHNNKLTDYDTTLYIPDNESSIDLDRIIFIGTSSTASASELIINGMKPYMNVELVGSPTDGKPVGMYVLEFQKYNWAAFPVSFKYTNALGAGDFYDGLQPDILVNDDVTRDFGDPEEGMLKAALNYINSGIITAAVKKSTTVSQIISSSKAISEFQRAY